MAKTQTAILASAIGAVALFALVIGAFTASSEPEQAEAICPEGSCLVELVELLTQDPCDVSDTGAGAAFINTCCEDFDSIDASFIDLCCEPLTVEESGGAFLNQCCEPQNGEDINAAFFSACCEENGGGSAAATFSLCCDRVPASDVDSTSFSLCCDTLPVAPPSTSFIEPGHGSDVVSMLFYNVVLNLLGRCQQQQF